MNNQIYQRNINLLFIWKYMEYEIAFSISVVGLILMIIYGFGKN